MEAFDRISREVMKWAVRQVGLLEAVVRAVAGLCDGAKTRVKVGSIYSEESEVKVRVHQGSVLSLLLYAIVVDVITECVRRNVIKEVFYVYERNHRSITKILELEESA